MCANWRIVVGDGLGRQASTASEKAGGKDDGESGKQERDKDGEWEDGKGDGGRRAVEGGVEGKGGGINARPEGRRKTAGLGLRRRLGRERGLVATNGTLLVG